MSSLKPTALTASLPVCSSCESVTPGFMCSHCRTALYCGRFCQRAHWAAHAPDCRSLSALSVHCLASCSLPPSPSLPVALYLASLLLYESLVPPCDAARVSCAQLGLSMLILDSDPVKSSFLARAALATAREHDGCDSINALQVSSMLARCLVSHFLPDLGLALLLDTCTRQARALGWAHMHTLTSLRLFLHNLPTPTVSL